MADKKKCGRGKSSISMKVTDIDWTTTLSEQEAAILSHDDIKSFILRICEEFAMGRTPTQILREHGIKPWIWYQVLKSSAELKALWDLADESHARVLADECLEIADDTVAEKGAVMRSNLRIAVRKWIVYSRKKIMHLGKLTGDLRSKTNQVLDCITQGQLTGDHGKLLMEIMGLQAKILETYDLEERIKSLEKGVRDRT